MIISRLILFIPLAILASFFSCKEPKNETFKIEKIKDIECLDVPFQSSQLLNSIYINDSASILFYLCTSEQKIGVYKLYDSSSKLLNKNKKYSFSNKLPINKHLFSSQFFIYSEDSIFFIDPSSNRILLIDTSMNVKNIYSLSLNYNPVINYFNNFIFSNNNIFYCWFPNNSNFALKTDRINYYQTVKPVCKMYLNRNTDSISNVSMGNFPESYIRTGNNYYDYFPRICVGSNHQIILSFSADDNVYVYKDEKLISSKICKSNYINKFEPIPDEKFKDFSFLKIYQGEQPRYINLIYDPYRKLYYRIAKHKFDIFNDNINLANWSIIIMTENFDVKGEVLLNYSEYLPDVILPCKEGIYLKKTPKSQKQSIGNIVLSLIKIVP